MAEADTQQPQATDPDAYLDDDDMGNDDLDLSFLDQDDDEKPATPKK